MWCAHSWRKCRIMVPVEALESVEDLVRRIREHEKSSEQRAHLRWWWRG